MFHRHLTMEERIGIAVFMHMSMSCRKIAAYPGRGHTTIFRKLRRSSSKAANLLNGRHAQKSKRCRAMSAGMSRSALFAYLDEKPCRDCSPKRLWGEFRSGQGKRVFPGRIDPEHRPQPVADSSRFGMGQSIWSVPPGARQRCSAARSAKGAFCCRPG